MVLCWSVLQRSLKISSETLEAVKMEHSLIGNNDFKSDCMSWNVQVYSLWELFEQT